MMIKPHFWKMGLILFLGIAGMALVFYATVWGPTVFSDSVYYLGSADNLVHGRGFGLYWGDNHFRPFAGDPPFYPYVVAFFQLSGIGVVAAARWVGILSFALIVTGSGWMAYYLSRSPGLGIGTSLFLFFPALQMSTNATSEVVFFPATLLGCMLVLYYLKTNARVHLVWAAVLTAAAFLRCPQCRVGAENYCEVAPLFYGCGLGYDGGLASHLIVPSAPFLCPLDGLDPRQAAPLTDAGLTTYHAVKRSLALLTPGSTAVVIGAGGLGQMAVQIARIEGCRVVGIAGGHFQRGVTARLQRAAQPDIVADTSRIEFISSSQINARFDITGATSGTWDLKVTNPDLDTYRVQQAFRVVTSTGIEGQRASSTFPTGLFLGAALPLHALK